MNTDNNRDDDGKDPTQWSLLQQEEPTDSNLLADFGLAALAGLSVFFSRVLTTVVEGHFAWRVFWSMVCIICLLCAIVLTIQGARHFGRRP